MLISALILLVTLTIFALGKSPVFRVDRAGAAIIGASLTVGLGILSFDQAARVIDYRTIVLLFAMMIIVSYLNLSGFFLIAGNSFLSRLRTKKQLLKMVIIITGVLSAFLINDIVCLLFTPIVIMICRQTKLPPLPYLLGVATASNIGSAATLIGNPQNILIGSLSGLRFASYFMVAAPVTVIGLVLIYWMISRVYQAELEGSLPETRPLCGAVHPYLVKKGMIVVGLVISGFLAGFDPAVMLLKFLIPPETGALWWTSMAMVSTIAGNLTLTGSIANLIVVELAKKQHIEISFFTYFKVGFPLTLVLVAVTIGYLALLSAWSVMP